MGAMTSAADLAHSLTTFIRDHMPLRRGASRHTILAYRDALKLFLRFAAARTGRSVPDLRVTDLDGETALGVLDALGAGRQSAVGVRGHGRAALEACHGCLWAGRAVARGMICRLGADAGLGRV